MYVPGGNDLSSISNENSYELTNKYYNNNDGENNWGESCIRGGSPGIENVLSCGSICDVEKCQENDDIAATCNDITVFGTYYGAKCECSNSYYYDGDTRSCYQVSSINDCQASVYSSETIITFDTVSESYVTGYTIDIDGGAPYKI